MTPTPTNLTYFYIQHSKSYKPTRPTLPTPQPYSPTTQIITTQYRLSVLATIMLCGAITIVILKIVRCDCVATLKVDLFAEHMTDKLQLWGFAQPLLKNRTVGITEG